MAASASIKHRGYSGRYKERSVDITMNTYATGGVALAAADCGVSRIIDVNFGSNADGYAFEYVDGDIVVYEQSTTTGVLIEATTDANLTAVTANATVVGI